MTHSHVFITGVTNSGTGMLRFLIGQHPATSVIEIEGHRFCAVLPHKKGRLFTQYPNVFRWTKDHLSIINTKKIKTDFYNKFDLKKNVFIEKSAHHMYRLEFWSEVFKPAKFVGVVRNGFAVSEGLRRRTGNDLRECAIHWNIANKIMIEDSAKVDFYFVKYEDLVADPQSILDNIFSFIGIDPVFIDLDMVMPRKNILQKEFTLRNSPNFNEESIKVLSQQDKDIIWQEAHNMMEYFGYENNI